MLTVGFENMGRLLLIIGGITAFLGLLLIAMGRIPHLGQLPGYIIIQRDNLSLYIPLATMVVASIVLTVLLNIPLRLWGR